VRTDEELEPDGYRVSSSGELIEQGEIDPRYLYAHIATLDLLGSRLAARAESEPQFGLMRFLAPEVAEDDVLAELLTMPAVEVVARRIGELSRPKDETASRAVAALDWSRSHLKSALTRGRGSRL